MKTKNLFMKSLVVLMLFAGMQTLTACFFDNPLAERGNGILQTEERTVRSFNAIDVSGGFEVVITQSDVESLVIEADENLMRFIITEVHGRELKIYTEGSISANAGLRAIISLKDLNSIDISGAVDLTATNTISGKDLLIDGSGASDIDLSLQYEKIDLDLSGASKVRLEGNAEKMFIEGSGASKIYAAELKTSTTKLDVSGASYAEIWATESLTLEASGASNIRYKGEPANIRTNTSGASNINKL
jgi:hypothetical protein